MHKLGYVVGGGWVWGKRGGEGMDESGGKGPKCNKCIYEEQEGGGGGGVACIASVCVSLGV